MKPILFEGHDIVLGAPPGWDAEKRGECAGLPIMRENGSCISLWEPDAHERRAIACGANVWLGVVSGQTQPPVHLSVGRIVVDPKTVDAFPVIIAGDGTPIGTTIVDVESGRQMTTVRSLTIAADVESGLLMARLVVLDVPEGLGAVVPDPVGLTCWAFIAERVAP